jgi:hypothetical protein
MIHRLHAQESLEHFAAVALDPEFILAIIQSELEPDDLLPCDLNPFDIPLPSNDKFPDSLHGVSKLVLGFLALNASLLARPRYWLEYVGGSAFVLGSSVGVDPLCVFALFSKRGHAAWVNGTCIR